MHTIQLVGGNLIAGESSRVGTEVFQSVNPRNKVVGHINFHNATPQEIDQAVEAAVEAFKITRTYSAEKLANFLETVAAEIEDLGDPLLELTDMETGLGLTRLTGERGRTTAQLRAFAALLREGSYVDAIIDTEVNVRRAQVPVGPVAVFSASNFPFAFAVAGGDTASAFAAGCPVIVKGHPSHPATSEMFAMAINKAIEKSDFPKGFFSLIQGTSVAVGQYLVEHPDIAAVGFTGSLAGGRAIFDVASRRPKPIPVYAEMGSVNPVVVMPQALKARGQAIAEGLVNSVILGSGQFCTNPGLVFLPNMPEADTFIRDVVNGMEHAQPGVLLNERIQDGLAKTVARTKEKTDLLTGGMRVEGSSYCFAHTVLRTESTIFVADNELQTEHFGPVTLIVLYKGMDDLVACIEHLHGNLSATMHADDDELDEAGNLLGILREKAGRLIWNGYPTGVAVVHAMHHGGPYPATTAPSTTSVGMTAIRRWMRPVAYQNLPDKLLPPALQDANPLNIWRIVNNQYSREAIG